MECLDYNGSTGEFLWKIAPRRNTPAGARAGCLTKAGYVVIGLFGKALKAHRLAWLVSYGQWPSKAIDHSNGVKWDNRIENLREADASQNSSNQVAPSNSTSGFKGVTYHKRHKKWQAKIMHRGKRHYLGVYRCPQEAAHAYNVAAIQLHGEFAVLNPVGDE